MGGSFPIHFQSNLDTIENKFEDIFQVTGEDYAGFNN
jgi:hypothetical protein